MKFGDKFPLRTKVEGQHVRHSKAFWEEINTLEIGTAQIYK